MKLYSFTGSCALAPHIALEWAGADYELELIKRSDAREPDFLKLNPIGKVPVLVLDDGTVLTQVVAVLMWIAEHFPDANLNPAAGPDDLYEARKWLTEFNGDIHPAFTPYFLTFRYADSKDAQNEVKAHAAQEVDHQLSIVEHHMEGRDWVMGDRRSVLDTYLFVFCLWAGFLPKPLKNYPNLAGFTDRMKADPGVQAAMSAQGLG
ncbi:MAG TPA: glutathione binding-like protein [Alphaproteobacteria bacterium]|nr:glutathione binding-like protein [Alphaproteobacteria bacterium]